LFEENGYRFSKDALLMLQEISFDYLFLYQALGYSLWQLLGRVEQVTVTALDIAEALETGKQLLFSKGYKQIWKELAKGQQEYLAALGTVADEDGVADSGEAARLNDKSSTQYSTVRRRMIELGHIEKQNDHAVRFALPYFWEFAARYQN
jgi:hypothetical protein